MAKGRRLQKPAEGASRLQVNTTIAQAIRLVAQAEDVSVSEYLNQILRKRSDYNHIIQLAAGVPGASSDSSDERQEVIETQGELHGTRDTGYPIPLDYLAHVYLRACSDGARRTTPMSPVDIATLDEVYTAALALSARPQDAQELYEHWVETYVAETEKPSPMDLLVQLHKYVVRVK